VAAGVAVAVPAIGADLGVAGLDAGRARNGTEGRPATAPMAALGR